VKGRQSQSNRKAIAKRLQSNCKLQGDFKAIARYCKARAKARAKRLLIECREVARIARQLRSDCNLIAKQLYTDRKSITSGLQ
jgi:tmRNA-binding protein